MSTKNLFSLNPIGAIYNIIARSLEAEQHSRARVISAAVNWNPGEGYKEHINGNGIREYYRIEREAKPRGLTEAKESREVAPKLEPVYKRMQG